MSTLPKGDIWVYAYGSLMWQPNFPYMEKCHARLHGYHRALCIYSIEYRGTAEKPGLVFGLNRGGSCNGIAFKVREKDASSVVLYLHEREMITGVYMPRWQKVQLCSNANRAAEKVTAYIFVADTAHNQYTGNIDDTETVKLVRQGHGKSGPCIDYLINTQDHLHELGIQDYTLSRIIKMASEPEH